MSQRNRFRNAKATEPMTREAMLKSSFERELSIKLMQVVHQFENGAEQYFCMKLLLFYQNEALEALKRSLSFGIININQYSLLTPIVSRTYQKYYTMLDCLGTEDKTLYESGVKTE